MQTGILVVETLGVILIVLLGLYLVRRIVGIDKLKSNQYRDSAKIPAL
jgi:hypothetical protein